MVFLATGWINSRILSTRNFVEVPIPLGRLLVSKADIGVDVVALRYCRTAFDIVVVTGSIVVNISAPKDRFLRAYDRRYTAEGIYPYVPSNLS